MTDFPSTDSWSHLAPEILWLYLISNLLLVAAYLAIPATLIVILRRNKALPHRWLYRMLAAFLFWGALCHLMDLISFWVPAQYFAGVVKAVAAALSLSMAILFVPLRPRIEDRPQPMDKARA